MRTKLVLHNSQGLISLKVCSQDSTFKNILITQKRHVKKRVYNLICCLRNLYFSEHRLFLYRHYLILFYFIQTYSQISSNVEFALKLSKSMSKVLGDRINCSETDD